MNPKCIFFDVLFSYFWNQSINTKMKRAIYYMILFSVISSFGCSTKQDTKTGASLRETEKRTDAGSYDYVKEEITITTDDNVNLSANYFYSEGMKESSQPLVVLIHQFRKNKEQWAVSFIDSLAGAGYKVLAYDIRGHGQSDKVNYELTDLLTDPNKAPVDVAGVFKWAKEQKGIDSTRIGVMGTSIGGNLACYARYYLGAKTVISVSNNEEGFEKFLGIDPRAMGRVMKRISSVMFICGSKDGNHEQEEKYIMDNYIMEPMELKVYDSDEHGINLIREFPEIRTIALNWFKKYL
jgi:pimeloyl-ACP methyl ester carboxylesterase